MYYILWRFTKCSTLSLVLLKNLSAADYFKTLFTLCRGLPGRMARLTKPTSLIRVLLDGSANSRSVNPSVALVSKRASSSSAAEDQPDAAVQQQRIRRRTLFDDSSSFTISYDRLRSGQDGETSAVADGDNPYLRSSLPSTVSGNVKNVQGWKGGASRGFRSIYPDVVQALTRTTQDKWGNDDLANWFRKLITHHLSANVLGKNQYGVLVPITYRQLLSKTPSKEQMNKAHLLGWGVELVRAANVLTAQSLGLQRHLMETRRDTFWAEKQRLGVEAFNDALFLSNSPHILLGAFFRDDTNYARYLDSYLYAIRSSTVGRLLRFNDHPLQAHGFEAYTYQNYQAMVRHNVTNIQYILPISLALHLKGISDSKVHENVRRIFEDVGLFAQVNRDYASYFLEDNDYRDIREGRLTWMIAMARQRVSAEQREILDSCYGSSDPEDLMQVRNIYKELKMKKAILAHISEKQQDIVGQIQQISKVDKLGLSPKFVFNLMKEMENLDWANVQ